MPFVSITCPEGLLSAEQKPQLLAGILDAVAAVEGEPLRLGIGLALQEVPATQMRNCTVYTSLTLIRGALNAAEREQMLKGVTEAIVSVIGENARQGVWVVLEENVANGEWLIGGLPLTYHVMERLKRGENPWPDGHSD